jgi:hypothetical protein
MNHHAIPARAEAASSHSTFAPDQEAQNMRSLALQLRRNGHQYRQWSREAAAKGHSVAAETFANRAARYFQDAIWYWKRSRL